MALTPDQRAELEALGADTVRVKLITGGPGAGASVPGFKTGHPGGLGGIITRSDIEDWLAEKHVEDVATRREEAAVLRSTLTWAKIAGMAAVVGVVVTAILGLIGIVVTVWHAK
jgi:hypothetical protein